jgi:hypothetical protein
MVSGFNLCYNSVTIFAKNLIIPVIFPFYHATHTYCEADFFVCADMAADVWNMVKTKGINARIAAGNVNKPHADCTMRAWVVAEAATPKWIALEPMGGNLVSRDRNKTYYRGGYFFTSPRDLKKYSKLYRQGSELFKRTQTLQGELKKVQTDYDQEFKKYNEMGDT